MPINSGRSNLSSPPLWFLYWVHTLKAAPDLEETEAPPPWAIIWTRLCGSWETLEGTLFVAGGVSFLLNSIPVRSAVFPQLCERKGGVIS